jgi:LPXTG-motif cell wall-anchored protein
MKKSLAAVALAGSIAFVGAVPAMAADDLTYNTGTTSEQGTVSDNTVAPGETFIFSASGFVPGESITVTVTLTRAPQAVGASFSGGASMAVPAKINLPLATQTFATKADANGNLSFPVSISEAGTYTLVATGVSGKTATASVTVAAASGTGAGLANTGGGTALANTGADTSLILWSLVGAGALAAGATSVVVVRRRAKAHAAA